MPCLFQYVQPHVINKSMFSMLRIRKNTHQLFDNHKSSQPTQYAKLVYCLEGLKTLTFYTNKTQVGWRSPCTEPEKDPKRRWKYGNKSLDII